MGDVGGLLLVGHAKLGQAKLATLRRRRHRSVSRRATRQDDQTHRRVFKHTLAALDVRRNVVLHCEHRREPPIRGRNLLWGNKPLTLLVGRRLTAAQLNKA